MSSIVLYRIGTHDVCDSSIPRSCGNAVVDVIIDGVTTTSSGLVDVDESLPSNVVNDDLYFHPHWLRYRHVIDTVPDWFIYGIGTYITIVCLAGIVGNSAVVLVFLRMPTLRTPSNYLIVNLAVSDAAFSMTVGFPMMSIACFRKRWMWGQTACEYYAFCAALCGFNSIGTMALIAIDRYRFASRPLEMLYKGTHRRAIANIIGVWTWSLFCTCPPLLGWGGYIAEGFQVSCTFDYLTRTTMNITYNYALNLVGFVLPVAVIVGCYVGIIRSTFSNTRQALQMRTSVANPVNTAVKRKKHIEQQRRQQQEYRMVKILAIMVALYVISWLPYALVAFFGIIGLSDLVTPYSAEIPVLLAKTSAVWNPIVYALTGWSKIYWRREQHRRLCKTWSSTSSSLRKGAKILIMRATEAPEGSAFTNPDEEKIEMQQLCNELLVEAQNETARTQLEACNPTSHASW